jgi:hypothetical protein
MEDEYPNSDKFQTLPELILVPQQEQKREKEV